MGERGWSLALLAVAACGRLRFEDRPMTGDGAGPAGDGAGGDTIGTSGIVRVQKEPATLTPVKCMQTTSCPVTFSGPTSAGDLIVVMITIDDTTTRSINAVNDSLGASYAAASTRPTVQGSNFGLAAIFYRENIPAAQALTVTVVADQMTYIDVAVAEYSGLPATGAFSGMATNACGACSNVDGGTLADGGLSVGVFTTANADVQSITMAPGWDGLASEATPLNAVMGAEDRIGTGNTLASWTTGFTGPKVGVSAKFGL